MASSSGTAAASAHVPTGDAEQRAHVGARDDRRRGPRRQRQAALRHRSKSADRVRATYVARRRASTWTMRPPRPHRRGGIDHQDEYSSPRPRAARLDAQPRDPQRRADEHRPRPARASPSARRARPIADLRIEVQADDARACSGPWRSSAALRRPAASGSAGVAGGMPQDPSAWQTPGSDGHGRQRQRHRRPRTQQGPPRRRDRTGEEPAERRRAREHGRVDAHHPAAQRVRDGSWMSVLVVAAMAMGPQPTMTIRTMLSGSDAREAQRRPSHAEAAAPTSSRRSDGRSRRRPSTWR